MSRRVRAINVGALLWSCRLWLLYALAYLWRRLLFRTTFIAITGSVGKTTAKECLAAILATQFSTASTLNNQNDRYGVPRTMLRVRPWHRFAVIEMGTDGPGLIKRSAQLVRPHEAIVLTVARSHTKVFSSLEEIAAEKSSLLDAVLPGGLAILNADDPSVRLMALSCRCQVKTFGLSAGQDLWADKVSSAWPETLTFRVHTRSEVEWVKTKLVGRHWTNSVLAGIAGALACGVPLKAAAAAVANVEPFPARMQPIKLPNGATMIRDELNGSYDTWQAAVKVLEASQAARRVLVMSDVSDWHKKSLKPRDRNKELGRIASRVAEVAIFVSEHAHHAVKAAEAAGIASERAIRRNHTMTGHDDGKRVVTVCGSHGSAGVERFLDALAFTMDSGATGFTYDANSNLLTVTDAKTPPTPLVKMANLGTTRSPASLCPEKPVTIFVTGKYENKGEDIGKNRMNRND